MLVFNRFPQIASGSKERQTDFEQSHGAFGKGLCEHQRFDVHRSV